MLPVRIYYFSLLNLLCRTSSLYLFSLLKSLRPFFSALCPDDLTPYFIKRESQEVGIPCFLLPNLSVDLHPHIFLSSFLLLQWMNCSSASQCQISCLCSISLSPLFQKLPFWSSHLSPKSSVSPSI